jgi:hypothetical protein
MRMLQAITQLRSVATTPNGDDQRESAPAMDQSSADFKTPKEKVRCCMKGHWHTAVRHVDMPSLPLPLSTFSLPLFVLHPPSLMRNSTVNPTPYDLRPTPHHAFLQGQERLLLIQNGSFAIGSGALP